MVIDTHRQSAIMFMMKHLFIDENVDILVDGEAELALARRNDSTFFVEGKGVPKVSDERWRTAQKAEKKHWIVLGSGADDDRNYEHFESFEKYRVLRGLEFNRAIELGCGPFTNLRIIGDVCRVRSCDLLDPLIREYMDHPHCSYRGGRIRLENTSIPRRLQAGLSRVERRFGRDLGWPRFRGSIPVGQAMPIPAEELTPGYQYDLVTMVNVIEHCYDIDLVLRNVAAATVRGGLLVLHDKYYDAQATEERLTSHYDAAHPLQVDRSVIDRFLAEHFSPLFYRVVPVAAEFTGRDVSADYYYYIGRRL